MRIVSIVLPSFVFTLSLVACGGTHEAASTDTVLSSNDPRYTGEEAMPSGPNVGNLSLGGPAGTHRLGGPVASDYADMTTWDPEQGRLVAYFGSGDSAFGLTLNLGSPFAIGTHALSTGAAVLETGDGFEQRTDVRSGNLTIVAIDPSAGTISLRLVGVTVPDEGQAPLDVALEASVVVPVARR